MSKNELTTSLIGSTLSVASSIPLSVVVRDIFNNYSESTTVGSMLLWYFYVFSYVPLCVHVDRCCPFNRHLNNI
jgi:hypothetical protein